MLQLTALTKFNNEDIRLGKSPQKDSYFFSYTGNTN